MRKILSAVFVLLMTLSAQAQYAAINALLDKLEAQRGINLDLSHVNVNNAKFVLVKDFEDHTERSFLVFKDDFVTYVEMFDDKKTGKTASNVFSGDLVRTQHNILSVRADRLEGEPIAVPLTKTLLLTQQKKILYLVDVNTKERWVDESAFGKK